MQEIDIVSLVKPATSAFNKRSIIDKISLEKAVYLARHGRPGPVWLDIPADIQNAKIEINNLKKFKPLIKNNKIIKMTIK